MKPTELFKRIYYALTGGVLLIAVNRLLWGWPHPLKSAAIIMIIGLVFCWIMSRHNNKRDGLMFCSIILLTFIFAIAYSLMMWRYLSYIDMNIFWREARGAMLFVGSACMALVGFRSNTKYYNILPNQSKTTSTIFRVLNWVGQFIIWVILCLLW